jgi:hypothetical protein
MTEERRTTILEANDENMQNLGLTSQMGAHQ